MPTQTFSNNSSTTVGTQQNIADTSLIVASSAGFPSSGPYTILVDNEYQLVTAGFGTTTWTVSRAQESTSAAQHLVGATVTQVLSVAGLTSLSQGFWTNYAPTGLTGATSATRYVGGTASAAPTTGPFLVGDFAIAQNGTVWVCVTAGTPGIWIAKGVPVGAAIGNGDDVTSTTYAAYPTHAGPAVTLNTGTTVKVELSATIANTSGSTFGYMGFTVDASLASDSLSVQADTGRATGSAFSLSASVLLTGLSVGSHTFTCQGRTNAGTSTHSNRNIIVTPM